MSKSVSKSRESLHGPIVNQAPDSGYRLLGGSRFHERNRRRDRGEDVANLRLESGYRATMISAAFVTAAAALPAASPSPRRRRYR